MGDTTTRQALAAVDRDDRSRLLAALTRRFGDLDLAEDVLQDAFEQALTSWSMTGVPDSPAAWLMTTAKRKAIDTVRRDAVLATKLAELHIESTRAPAAREPIDGSVIGDDRLGMFFACTHPVLRPEDRIALTLRFVGGLSAPEVAHALLVPTPTVQQRIVRAKKRIRTLGVPFSPPEIDELPARLDVVLRVVYLMFAEGFARSAGDAHVADDLAAEAIRLAHVLHGLLPCAETAGLLALLLLTHARRPARLDDVGGPIPLGDQDRTRWDRALIAEGVVLAEQAAADPDAGPYAVQASIAAVHAEARTAAATDWQQIAVLYRILESFDPGPVVRVGRAVAVGRAFGPRVGLRMLDALASEPVLDRYRPFHIARALTLTELGEAADAADAYRRARHLPGNEAEDDYLAALLATSTSPRGTIG
ncbi:sigma-70 family RNA polymerase sigma factor [Gordonia sp. HY285]|uniref:RNA polymerase sigma factor n=1 Tax=Gordonia liuliyuniae TaxID=2911517 RepID=UPI001F0037FE|nr:sigma-70 family RNA polymerase sigma factor [Gordonia liuliyuniae]MCF8611028.1 sigma-70 family RNA polymerase sigma factor [Gordonia liuliyuniae]